MTMPKDPVRRAATIERMRQAALRRPRQPIGSASPSYRGGGIDKNGYRFFVVDGKQHFEHRLVMEKIVGRKLHPHETVHHKNGQRSDNRPENLELWSTRNPKGQRIADKVEWAISFLREYGVIVNRPQSDSAWVSGLLSI